MSDLTVFIQQHIFLIGGLYTVFAGLLIAVSYIQYRRLPYYPIEYLLTHSEKSFYKALKQTKGIGDVFDIYVKVRLADIVHCSKAMWDIGHGRKIATQHIDFVMTDPATSRVRFCVELDGVTHNHPRQKRKDNWKNLVLDKSNILLIRFKSQNYYDCDYIRKRVFANLHSQGQVKG